MYVEMYLRAIAQRRFKDGGVFIRVSVRNLEKTQTKPPRSHSPFLYEAIAVSVVGDKICDREVNTRSFKLRIGMILAFAGS